MKYVKAFLTGFFWGVFCVLNEIKEDPPTPAPTHRFISDRPILRKIKYK